jgi:hypothetical protein
MVSSYTDKLSTEKRKQYYISTRNTDRKLTEFWEIYIYTVISYIMQRPSLESCDVKENTSFIHRSHQYSTTIMDV